MERFASATMASSPEIIAIGTPKWLATAALNPASETDVELRRTSVKVALENVWARTPAGFDVEAWYPMKRTQSKVASMPSIIPRGRGQERTIETSSGNFSMRRFWPFPWESLTRNSVAPAARAPRMAARTSSVMNSRNRWYSKPAIPICSPLTTPPMPSMSAEM